MKNTDPAAARPALAENPQGQCASDAAPARLWQNGDLMEASDARCDMQDCAADRRPTRFARYIWCGRSTAKPRCAAN